MLQVSFRVPGCVLVIVLAGARPAAAECPNVDFDDFPLNTAVTAQYPGVTFSVQGLPPSCGVSFGRIQAPVQGTSSAPTALCVDGGSTPTPDCQFHPQWLRMVFDNPVHDVRFSVGPGGNGSQDYEVRVYTTCPSRKHRTPCQ